MARKSNKEGRVLIKFMVNEDGKISDASVLSGFDSECDAEALRVASTMPPWQPGKNGGKAVKVFYTQPITFKLR